MEKEKVLRSCADCGVMNCLNRNSKYPEFCPTTELTEEEIEQVVSLYTNSRVNKKVAEQPLRSRANSMEDTPELRR